MAHTRLYKQPDFGLVGPDAILANPSFDKYEIPYLVESYENITGSDAEMGKAICALLKATQQFRYKSTSEPALKEMRDSTYTANDYTSALANVTAAIRLAETAAADGKHQKLNWRFDVLDNVISYCKASVSERLRVMRDSNDAMYLHYLQSPLKSLINPAEVNAKVNGQVKFRA